MSVKAIADGLVALGEKIQHLFDAGKKAEYDKFWDNFQNNGGTENYNYAFSMGRFSDENYNPKYPIKCSSGTTGGRYMFYNATGITDTKVEIIPSTDLANAFNTSGIVTIRKLTVKESITYSSTFTETNNLIDITFDGLIGQNISFRYCSKLSSASIQNIIDHLATVTSAKTLTLHSTTAGKLTENQLLQIANKNWQVG